MLFFFAWGLASYGSSGFPFFFIHTLSIWSESWSYSRLPSYGFYPGSGNLSGAETAWPLLEKDAPIPLALPYDLGQLSSYLFYPLTKATHTSSFWGRAPPLWVLWGSSSFSYWKSSVSLFYFLNFFLFSGAKPYRWRILRHLKTTPRLSLNLLSVDFLPRSVANELICLSGPLKAGSIKVLPGRDGHVLSRKDIRFFQASTRSLDRMAWS